MVSLLPHDLRDSPRKTHIVVTQDSSQRRLGTAAAKPIKKKEKIRKHGAKNVFFYLLPS
jgi:hypothetical protein